MEDHGARLRLGPAAAHFTTADRGMMLNAHVLLLQEMWATVAMVCK